jgi:hypothetical protein
VTATPDPATATGALLALLAVALRENALLVAELAQATRVILRTSAANALLVAELTDPEPAVLTSRAET